MRPVERHAKVAGPFRDADSSVILGSLITLRLCRCQVVPYGERVRVVGAEDPLMVGESLFQDGDGLINATRRTIRGGQVGARADRLGVVGAEDPLVAGESLFRDRDGFTGTARRPVG